MLMDELWGEIEIKSMIVLSILVLEAREIGKAKFSAIGIRVNYRTNYLTAGPRANCGVNYSAVGNRAKKKF